MVSATSDVVLVGLTVSANNRHLYQSILSRWCLTSMPSNSARSSAVRSAIRTARVRQATPPWHLRKHAGDDREQRHGGTSEQGGDHHAPIPSIGISSPRCSPSM
ncbi:hypothetical protein XH80_34955 [Bradyrhizobium sp. CCBAU 45384]|nr:hypothetical protein [Bradyrhizobium sp. CCBAU 45384]